MKTLRYALSHMTGILIAGIIITVLLTSFIFEIRSQLRSAADGVEVLMIDSSLSVGDADRLGAQIKKVSGIKYTGVATLSSSEAENYIRTIDNYSMTEYIKYLTASRDSELVILPESMLETVFATGKAVPLDFDAEFTDASFFGGTPCALPLDGLEVTDYGAKVLCVQSMPYAILLNGDHTDEARAYLISLTENKEDPNV